MNEPARREEDSLIVSTSSQTQKRRNRTILDYWNSFDLSIPTRSGRAKDSRRVRKTAGPMARLWRAMRNAERVLVLTRGLREPRASLIGNLTAFDRYWNLILSHVTECSVDIDQSALSGHGRPGRSKRRRQQRLSNLLKRCGHLLDPSVPGHFQSIRELYRAHYNRGGQCGKPMEIGQLIPSIGAMDQEAEVSAADMSCPIAVRALHSTNQASLPGCPERRAAGDSAGTEVPRPCSLSAVAMLGTSSSVAASIPDQVHSHSIANQAHRPRTHMSHHAQLFIRGANVVYISFLKTSDQGLMPNSVTGR